MIEQSRHPLDVVARETGFRDRRPLREAFVRGFGLPPQARCGAPQAVRRGTGA
jgi:transcriptional regulator GlxA family with amidase domain